MNKVDDFYADAKKNTAGIKNIVLVMSGKGGVGKSTVAVNTAVSLALNGKRTAILDADIYGPSIPLMLGIDGSQVEQIGDKLIPVKIAGSLGAMSAGLLLEEKNKPFIWRGPACSSFVTSLLRDVEWGELDYLVIDCPPGTGDIPLTLSQAVNVRGALIVTSPQEVALSDVRKCIGFCASTGIEILGIIENMSWFECDSCGKKHFILGQGGGQTLAEESNSELFTQIPFSELVSESGDNGKPFAYFDNGNMAVRNAMAELTDKLIGKCETGKIENNQTGGKMENVKIEKIAIPMVAGNLCLHFGHCEQFLIADVEENGTIVNKTLETPPEHEPGILPKWISEKKVNTIIAGGMGSRARGLFEQYGVKVITGAEGENPEELIKSYKNNKLVTGENTCDH